MFQTTDYPEFSWSLSRHKTLMECPRKYAYDYYAYHNGWLYHSSDFAKHVYRLKKITNLEMLFGQVTHEIIEQVIFHYIQMKAIPTEKELIEKLRDRLNDGFIDATKRKHLWENKPKHYTMLHEIYYYNQLPLKR